MCSCATRVTRFLRYSLAVLVIAGQCGIVRGQQKTAPAEEKPKIRAITAFINLDRARYQEQVADALKMLKRGQTILESRGYQVQTIRIATQPFPEYTKGLTAEQAVAFFKDYDALASREKFAASIGPAMLDRKSTRLNSSHSQISYAVFCLKKKDTYSGSLITV